MNPEETNVLYDDRGQPDAAAEEDAAIESRLDCPLIRKTRPALPTSIDPEFNVQFDEALHGDYLREHLHTGHLSPAIAAQLTKLIKNIGASSIQMEFACP